MKIVCCVKQVPDPETPARAFRVNEAQKRVEPAPGIAPVISQFDQIGVEAALRLRDSSSDSQIVVLTLGPDSARDVLKVGLAMGADEGVHLNDSDLFNGDSHFTAFALAAAIEKIGDVDVVICGRQATDWDFGFTGIAIAEILGWPCATVAKQVSVHDGVLSVVRVLTSSFETVELSLPAVVTVSNELGEPRYPTLPQIMQAGRKQVTTWGLTDLGLSKEDVGTNGVRLQLESLFVPEVNSACEFIEAEDAEGMAVGLVRRLREMKVI